MIEGLKRILLDDQIKTDPSDLENYGRDWTRAHTPSPAVIVFPRTTEEVRKIIQWARAQRLKIVPSGGRSGLSGGAVAASGEVVLSLSQMNQILEFNEVDRFLRVQAGVVTEEAQNFLKDRGYYLPIDFGSRGSSQIGGNVSTNAGGTKVIRYGLTREWVRGLTVVTGAGEILKLDQNLIKNNAGYDLKQLFIGSEGTLGVVTEVSLEFTEPPKDLRVILMQGEKLEAAMDVLQKFQATTSLTAFEFFTNEALDFVLAKGGIHCPFSDRSPFYFLVEFEAPTEEAFEAGIGAYEELESTGGVRDAVVSQFEKEALELWALRENISEALSPFRPYKNDISIRISEIPAFVKEADALFRQKFPGVNSVWFGHIGDGNLHINLIKRGDQSAEDFRAQTDSISQALFDLVKSYNGSISAEHGIGLLKKPYLSYSRSAEEIHMMKQLKAVFDPDQVLNPGKIFD